MNPELSNARQSDTPSRAAAQNDSSSGLSRPAVQPIQKALKDGPDEPEEYIKEPMFPKERDNAIISPFQLKPDNSSSTKQRQLPQEAWHVVQQKQAIVQRKKIVVTTSKASYNWGNTGEIDHKDLLRFIRRRDIENGCINISEEDTFYITIDDLISSIEDAIDDDERINKELEYLVSELEKIRDGDEQEEVEPIKDLKRKREDQQATSNKEGKIYAEEDIKSQRARNAATRETEDTDMDIQEQSPEEPLKFVAWNANHFGEGNSLQEAEIIEHIKSLDSKEIIEKISGLGSKFNVSNKKQKIEYSAPETINYLQVLDALTEKLPSYDEISKVNQLMNAAGSLGYIFKRLKEEDTFYTPKIALISAITGALKKHYMMAHTSHLMQVHPNLIMGFNEVGKGVEFMQETLEDKEDLDGGVKVEKGPKLQAVSINVAKLNESMEWYNDMFKEELGKNELTPVEPKKKYTDSDYEEQFKAFNTMGMPDDLLNKSQIEYYPIVFNSDKYAYNGFIAVSGNNIETDTAEINWTKNPYLSDYSQFRPIVVHKLLRKDEEGNTHGNGIWYGMVHTTPSGNEFDRRDIYEGQLQEALPKIKALAEADNAQLIIGGDYYIAEEALVKTPSTLKTKGNKYKNKSDNDFSITAKEIKDNELKSNSPVGWSDNSLSYSTGTTQGVRNLVHPESRAPYNYKGNLENEELASARSVTGTNKTDLGLQSADYFIVDPATSKTQRAAVINPVTGLPFHLESEDKELSNAWFSFSDHVPVMLVVSAEKNDKNVDNAFPSNKGYFNNSPDNLNPFDLKFLQVSNARAHAINNEIEIPAEMEDAYNSMLEKRKSGIYTDEDMTTLTNLKEAFLQYNESEEFISMEMFEPYQASNAFITTILYQIWSDIYELQLDNEEQELLDFIQDARMIIKEDKINAAYRISEKKDAEAATWLSKYLGGENLKEIDKLYEKKKRDKKDVTAFIQLKKKLQQDLLDKITEKIGQYKKEVENDSLFNEKDQYNNFIQNYILLGDIIGKNVIMSNDRKHEHDDADDEPHGSFAQGGGIPNNGTDCFINAVFQLLSLPAYLPLRLDNTVQNFVQKVINKEEIKDTEVSTLRSHLINYKQINTENEQEDSAELLGKLMDKIDLDPEQDKELLEEIQAMHKKYFKYTASNRRTILASDNNPEFQDKVKDDNPAQWIDGKNTSAPITENVLNIPVANTEGLIDWLNATKEFVFNPDYDNLKTVDWALVDGVWLSLRKVAEKTIFSYLPDVLTIALSRFNNDLTKLNNPFKMPEVFELYEEGDDGIVLKIYTLKGFIYHRGKTLQGGHYWAHRKDDEGGWNKANDENVSPSDMTDKNTEGAFMHDINNGYIYTYVLSARRDVEETGEARALAEYENSDDDEKQNENNKDEWFTNAQKNIASYKAQQDKWSDQYNEDEQMDDDNVVLFDDDDFNNEEDVDAEEFSE